MNRNEAAIDLAKLIKQKTVENNVPQIPRNRHGVIDGWIFFICAAQLSKYVI